MDKTQTMVLVDRTIEHKIVIDEIELENVEKFTYFENNNYSICFRL